MWFKWEMHIFANLMNYKCNIKPSEGKVLQSFNYVEIHIRVMERYSIRLC
jgi:hypothetical protein